MAVRHAMRLARRANMVDRAVLRGRWGSLRRVGPESEWGFERGLPVDRWYIDRFLAEHQPLVRGHALEIKEDLYATKLGASTVDILDIDRANDRATIVGDLCVANTLPSTTFEVAIVTQTLQLVQDPVAAVRLLLSSLSAGGHLLLTVPAVSRIAGDADRWRWTALGLAQMLEEAGAANAEVSSHGNLLSCRSFLAGLGADDLPRSALGQHDPMFPLVVAAVIRKEQEG